ncbi:MAG TPA: hypothetical protein VFQ38_04700 [Longimicrobiales bacterium]|nr:hypothetical protein [Longimicrobiales bacterium]
MVAVALLATVIVPVRLLDGQGVVADSVYEEEDDGEATPIVAV